jgi:hypothetical protein
VRLEGIVQLLSEFQAAGVDNLKGRIGVTYIQRQC